MFSSIVVLYGLFMGKVLGSNVPCLRGGTSIKSSAYFDLGLECVICGLLLKTGEQEQDLSGELIQLLWKPLFK